MNLNQSQPFVQGETRRQFLRKTSAIVAGAALAPLLSGPASAQRSAPGVAIVLDPDDAVTREKPVRWAAEQLRDAISSRGLATGLYEAIAQAPAGSACILATSRRSMLAQQVLQGAGAVVPDVPEAFGLVRGRAGERLVLLACGSDPRGLVYALLELADRVSCAARPLTILTATPSSVERPANRIRSIARAFVSDVEDKGWFNDRDAWRQYLTMLATQRFNRFSLMLGIGYDFTTGIRDCYFHFAYPFLVSMPGYAVRAAPLPDSERERNLQMLRFISDEAALRGLHFQLGLWTHAYQWADSPHANFTIKGLAPETHGPYCRDALRAVLEACPAIRGVTFRTHGESGVAEGSYDFWKMVFDGVVQCGRTVEIDLHAKGMDQRMIDIALATGLPVNVSPKFWAEHLGLPYMQTEIRALEMPPHDARDAGFFSKSSGSRRFLRYGYGDLLTEDRRYGILHRVWPGTQRLLLWGDPVIAAGYGRASSFCGSDGVEFCEPLFFKGRKGSGLPGGRDAYAEGALRTGGDWEKYLYTYRLWGRLTYNPDAGPDQWRRWLRKQFGAQADSVETALASASRILPLVTTAHCPSAANNNYWPEMYTNMPIVDPKRAHPYGDTQAPKRFGSVSPLDPGLFLSLDAHAEELLKEKQSGKYSASEVAQWLAHLADTAAKKLPDAKLGKNAGPEFRRLAVDVKIQSGLGRFFGYKFQAGVLYALYERSGHRPALEESVKAYQSARNAWAQLAEEARDVYVPDVTFGYDKHLRGHWLDRLEAIDADIADMRQKLSESEHRQALLPKVEPESVERAIRAVLQPPRRRVASVEHQPPASFRRGEPVMIELAARRSRLAGVRLHYRRVNQAEPWRVAEMLPKAGVFAVAIPGEYTDSAFPLEYFFEMRDKSGTPHLHPGFDVTLANQPYFVVRCG